MVDQVVGGSHEAGNNTTSCNGKHTGTNKGRDPDNRQQTTRGPRTREERAGCDCRERLLEWDLCRPQNDSVFVFVSWLELRRIGLHTSSSWLLWSLTLGNARQASKPALARRGLVATSPMPFSSNILLVIPNGQITFRTLFRTCSAAK
jgi:hypothetical protein